MTVALSNVTIRYGEKIAVHDLSVEFPRGAVALLGRNGAGKSSVLRALLGLVRPASGEIRIDDVPITRHSAATRRHIGYMPEREAYVPQATAFEMVALLGRLSGMPRRDAWRRAHEVLYLVGLDEQRYRPVSGYSAGMRQKTKLAAALVHDPRLVLLDEPTNGLDPGGRDDMLALIRRLGELGKSVVLSTHILPDVEDVCAAAVVLEKGRVVAQGSLHELTQGGPWQCEVVVEPRSLVFTLPQVPEASVQRIGDGRFAVRMPENVGTAPVFAAVLAAGGAVRALVPRRRSLEDVFLGAIANVS